MELKDYNLLRSQISSAVDDLLSEIDSAWRVRQDATVNRSQIRKVDRALVETNCSVIALMKALKVGREHPKELLAEKLPPAGISSTDEVLGAFEHQANRVIKRIEGLLQEMPRHHPLRADRGSTGAGLVDSALLTRLSREIERGNLAGAESFLEAQIDQHGSDANLLCLLAMFREWRGDVLVAIDLVGQALHASWTFEHRLILCRLLGVAGFPANAAQSLIVEDPHALHNILSKLPGHGTHDG